MNPEDPFRLALLAVFVPVMSVAAYSPLAGAIGRAVVAS